MTDKAALLFAKVSAENATLVAMQTTNISVPGFYCPFEFEDVEKRIKTAIAEFQKREVKAQCFACKKELFEGDPTARVDGALFCLECGFKERARLVCIGKNFITEFTFL